MEREMGSDYIKWQLQILITASSAVENNGCNRCPYLCNIVDYQLLLVMGLLFLPIKKTMKILQQLPVKAFTSLPVFFCHFVFVCDSSWSFLICCKKLCTCTFYHHGLILYEAFLPYMVWGLSIQFSTLFLSCVALHPFSTEVNQLYRFEKTGCENSQIAITAFCFLFSKTE